MSVLVVACPACHRRCLAAGYRDQHCVACGALVQPVLAPPCPRCELPLQARAIADLVIDECTRCGGVFVARDAVDLMLGDEQHVRAEALLDALPRSEHHPLPPPGGKMYVRCPTCAATMNRRLFAAGSGVVVDVCKAHGTFFDAGELPAIIGFVQAGGLARAAKKTARDQREREERRAAESRLSTQTLGATEVGSRGATALVELLLALFR